MKAKICPVCGAKFHPVTHQTYCNPKCALEAEHNRQSNKDLPMLTCAVCGTVFEPTVSWQKYCSPRCKVKHEAARYKTRVTRHLPTGTVGAMSELLAATDLLMKGYEVFRALSPSASCDLAVLREGKLLKVEVRTGCKDRNGKFGVSAKGIHDILAIVEIESHQVIYDPAVF